MTVEPFIPLLFAALAVGKATEPPPTTITETSIKKDETPLKNNNMIFVIVGAAVLILILLYIQFKPSGDQQQLPLYSGGRPMYY